LFDLYTIAICSAVIGFIAGHLLSIRKESIMANSADKLTAAFNKVAAALKASEDKVADLTAQLAAVDTTATADLAADETAIADVVAQVDTLVPDQPAA